MLSHTQPHSDPDSDAQLDDIAEHFFNAPPSEPGDELADAEPRASRLSRSERRAMRATFAMLGLFGVALGAFVVYTRLIMPVPAEIGLERAIELPVPGASMVPQPSAAELPAPAEPASP